MNDIPQTVDQLEEAFVRWHDLWWRSPGDGASPWAKDGPWYLAQGEVGDVKGDWSTTLITNEAGRELEVRKVDSRRPRAALDCAEVAERDRTGEWLALLGDPAAERLLGRATWWLWKGQNPVPWTRLAAQLGWQRTPAALRMAYRRAMGALLCRLHGRPRRFWREYLGREGLAVPTGARPAFVVVDDLVGEG